MNNHQIKRQQPGSTSAFTMIEMVAVIGIIILLAGLLVPAVQKAREAAKKTKAQVEVRTLESALKNFETDYGTWPSVTATNTFYLDNYIIDKSDPDDSIAGQAVLIYILNGNKTPFDSVQSGKTGVHAEATAVNSKNKDYLDLKPADTRHGGNLDHTQVGRFVDPWGHPYRFMFDLAWPNNQGSVSSMNADNFKPTGTWFYGPAVPQCYATGSQLRIIQPYDPDSPNSGSSSFYNAVRAQDLAYDNRIWNPDPRSHDDKAVGYRVSPQYLPTSVLVWSAGPDGADSREFLVKNGKRDYTEWKDNITSW